MIQFIRPILGIFQINCIQNSLYKTNLIFFVILLSYFNSYGQKSMGIKLNGGVSRVFITEKNGKSFNHSNYSQLTYNGGVYFSRILSPRLKLGTEIIFSRINGKDNFNYLIPADSINSNKRDYSNTVWRKYSYLGFPIYIGYFYKKINLILGLQTNFKLGGYEQEIGRIYVNGGASSWNRKYSTLNGTNLIDLGIRSGLIFDVTKRIGIESNFYFSLNNINKGDNTSNWRKKNGSFTMNYPVITLKTRKRKQVMAAVISLTIQCLKATVQASGMNARTAKSLVMANLNWVSKHNPTKTENLRKEGGCFQKRQS